MALSPVFVPIIGGECSPGDGFPLGKTTRFESLEFVADRFGGLSLSLLRGSSGAVIMGPACGGPPLLQWTITGSTIEGFPTTPGEEGRTGLLFKGRHGAESPPISTMTILRPMNPSIDQAMMTIPLWPDDNPTPLEQRRTCREATQ
jgi:hypothetical protein